MPKLNLMAPIIMGAEDAEASQGALEIVNGYIENSGGLPAIKLRPGLGLLHDTKTGARVDAYWWEAKRILVMATGRKIYAKTSKTGALYDITPLLSANTLPFNAKVLFSADEYGVTMTAGKFMLWWNGDVLQPTIRVTDVNAPATISSITYLKGYTIASVPNTQTFQWALYGPTDDRTIPPPWNPLSISASASPDNIVCMGSGWEELFILGRESAQSHYASGDATIPFPALNGSVAETGTVNANTLQKLGNGWVYFTPNYQIVRMEGRNPRVLSQAIDKELRRLQYFDEAEAFTVFDRFYVLTFPQDDRTYVFDNVSQLWFRWERWDSYTVKYREFNGVSSVFAKPWGQQIVGGADGKVYELSYDYTADYDQRIRFQLRSGFIDHGTSDRKFSAELKMRLKRGVGGIAKELSEITTPASYGSNWTAIELLDETPTNILYATDGYVYITGVSKIWRTTTDFATFTEMTLDGVLTGASFGVLAEVSGGHIVAIDDGYLWVKAAGTTTFTKITGGVYDPDAEGPLGYFGPTIVGLSAVKPCPGILNAEGDIVLVAGDTSGIYVYHWNKSTDTGTPISLNANTYNMNVAPVIALAEDGTLYIVGNINGTPAYNGMWKSVDGGLTWAGPAAITGAELGHENALLAPVDGTILYFCLGTVRRSIDELASIGAVEFDFDGNQVRSACMLPGYKIAVVTDGTTTANLYTLQGTPAQEILIPATDRKLLIRWRNDGRNEWSNYREVSLGKLGDTEIFKRISGLGSYRNRQYEIVCTSGVPLTIAGLEENVNLGGTSGE